MAVLAVLTMASVVHASGYPFPESGPEYYTFTSTFFPITWTGTTMDAFHKEITEAKEDIAYFVSSEGQVRTARFEKALAYTKQNFNVANANDKEISQALLAEFQ